MSQQLGSDLWMLSGTGVGALGGLGCSHPVSCCCQGASLAVSCHAQPRGGHLLSTVLFSPECPEDRGFGIVMVLQCPHFWGSHPEEREYLVSIPWPEIFSIVKQLEVNIKDVIYLIKKKKIEVQTTQLQS